MGIWGRALAIFAVVGLTGAGLAMWQLTQRAKLGANSPNLLDLPRHEVTEPMWQRARAVSGQPAPDFTLLNPESKPVTLHEECKKGPVVLVFTKDGCPCSMEAQPLFNQLAKGFGDKVVFLGVIDGADHVASKFHDDFSVPYQMLLAGDGAVFKAFKARQSTYSTLIGTDGVVIKQWPGYSKTMMKELDDAIAQAAKTKPVQIDTSEAPDTMNSGCKFD